MVVAVAMETEVVARANATAVDVVAPAGAAEAV